MKKPHFDPKSKNWIISLIIMIIVSVAVIFGSQAIYNHANGKPADGRYTALPVSSVILE